MGFNMKASEKNIESIIEGKKQYIIPLFQRSYVWEKEHWQTLWDDLIELYHNKGNHLSKENHFLGSFVTTPFVENTEKSPKKFLLIDGQQRLTTIFILLAILRDKAQDKNNKIKEEINQTYLFNPFLEDENRYKLLLTDLQGDKECFKRLLLNQEINNKKNLIFKAFNFFKKRFLEKDYDVSRFEKIITNNLQIVHVELNEDEDPYKIFESLNAKGEELSQADLIRNYFFMKIDMEQNKKNEFYQQHWKPMQSKLENNLSEYFRHFLMRTGKVVKKNEVYSTLKKENDNLTSQEIEGYLKDSIKFSNYYEELLFPNKKRNRKKDITDRITGLNEIECTAAYPFLLNVYHDYEEKHITDKDFIEILDLIENFLIRRSICGKTTRYLGAFFPSVYCKAKNDQNFLSAIKKQFLQQEYPNNNEFKESFVNKQLYNNTAIKKVRFILKRLELFENKEPVDLEHNKTITIEHVMPQKLTAWWEKHLGKEHNDIHEKLSNTIGNLTLSSSNSKLSQSEFHQKKRILADSNLKLNKYIITLNKWDSETIIQRGYFLAEIALKIWPDFSYGISYKEQASRVR